jgi:hypothetical protein
MDHEQAGTIPEQFWGEWYKWARSVKVAPSLGTYFVKPLLVHPRIVPARTKLQPFLPVPPLYTPDDFIRLVFPELLHLAYHPPSSSLLVHPNSIGVYIIIARSYLIASHHIHCVTVLRPINAKY